MKTTTTTPIERAGRSESPTPRLRSSDSDVSEEGQLSARSEGPGGASAVIEGFAAELVRWREQLVNLSEQKASELGRSAAAQIAASVAWSRIVGDRLDTSEVTRMLGVSRQALLKRRAKGSLLGVRGRGVTWFPVWQFDTVAHRVRPIVSDVVAVFREHLGEVDPVLIASWATTGQDEDLDGETPADWVVSGRDGGRLIKAAHRAAVRLAQ